MSDLSGSSFQKTGIDNAVVLPDSRSQIPGASQSGTGDNVAIVHDWLYGGGAEKVVEQLHQLYPDAPIYTGSTTDEWRERLDDQVVTGWPNWWPFNRLRKYMALPLGWWFRSLDLSEYDLIIISTGNGEAKQIRKTGEATIVCYCHTPVHFYWKHYSQYIDQPGFGVFNPLARLGLKILVKPLRRRDYQAAQSIDHWITNSTEIKTVLEQFYGKNSEVIHPPVDVNRFSSLSQKRSTLDVRRSTSSPTPNPQPRHPGLDPGSTSENEAIPSTIYRLPSTRSYFVTVGRLVPYKRVDIIIATCERLGLSLKVIGRGPELANLQRLAGDNTEIITDASDEDVVNYLAGAEAFIFAAHEDFGITPVESLASGTPIIAYRAGGALDYVTEQTGVFFDEQTVDSLTTALKIFDSSMFDNDQLHSAAKQFDKRHFRRKFTEFISELKS